MLKLLERLTCILLGHNWSTATQFRMCLCCGDVSSLIRLAAGYRRERDEAVAMLNRLPLAVYNEYLEPVLGESTDAD